MKTSPGKNFLRYVFSIRISDPAGNQIYLGNWGKQGPLVKYLVQLNKYETAPYFFLLNQNLTWDCLLIFVFLPQFD